MSFKLIRVALMALLMVVLPSWANDNIPPSAKPAVEILSLNLHSSDKGEARPWKQIGVDPFTGDVKKGGEILMKDTAIRISEVQEAWQMRLRNECHSYNLKNGDKVRTTFGAGKSLPAEVAFASSAGDPERRGDVCLVRADGTAVVFLDGCGNISVAQANVRKIKPPPAPPATAASAPVKVVEGPLKVETEEVCELIPVRLGVSNISRNTTIMPGRLNDTCIGTQWISGLHTSSGGGTGQTFGYVQYCQTVDKK